MLSALGIYQRPTGNGPQSWLVLASLVAPQSGPGFTMQGVGLLFGSNRTTDPEAFLAGIATGDLDAVLFPDDPIGKASQYLAALERLFPTKRDATVLGISVQFGALEGRITFDLGVIIDIQNDAIVRIYLVAQFVAVSSAPSPGQRIDPAKQAVYILADGVAVYDFTTNELNVRIALRNSHVWKGELTGGASLFHGSPQVDGGARGTYVSIGGFHPDYVPPGTKIFVPPRLSLVLGKGDHLKLQVTSYIAYTPTSFQFGFSGRLDARLYGFGIRGSLTIDLLAGFDGQLQPRPGVQRRVARRLALARRGVLLRLAGRDRADGPQRQGVGQLPVLLDQRPRLADDPGGRVPRAVGRHHRHRDVGDLRAGQLGQRRDGRAEAGRPRP